MQHKGEKQFQVLFLSYFPKQVYSISFINNAVKNKDGAIFQTTYSRITISANSVVIFQNNTSAKGGSILATPQ